jgi:hypothetical protein
VLLIKDRRGWRCLASFSIIDSGMFNGLDSGPSAVRVCFSVPISALLRAPDRGVEARYTATKMVVPMVSCVQLGR